jgi:phage shock protein PspC (stress-responsive transcriptional regulator)
MEPKRLYRSYLDRKVAGVAAGLGEYFDIDPLLVRLLFVILTLIGGGGVLIYIILWIITPEAPYKLNDIGTSNTSSKPSGNGANEQNEKSQEGYQEYRETTDTPKTPAAPAPVKKQRGSLIGGLVLITIGGLFLADELLPGVNFWDFWPVILIVIGGGMLINTMIKRNMATEHDSQS